MAPKPANASRTRRAAPTSEGRAAHKAAAGKGAGAAKAGKPTLNPAPKVNYLLLALALGAPIGIAIFCIGRDRMRHRAAQGHAVSGVEPPPEVGHLSGLDDDEPDSPRHDPYADSFAHGPASGDEEEGGAKYTL